MQNYNQLWDHIDQNINVFDQVCLGSNIISEGIQREI